MAFFYVSFSSIDLRIFSIASLHCVLVEIFMAYFVDTDSSTATFVYFTERFGTFLYLFDFYGVTLRWASVSLKKELSLKGALTF